MFFPFLSFGADGRVGYRPICASHLPVVRGGVVRHGGEALVQCGDRSRSRVSGGLEGAGW
jgi:hypothetical protein